MNSVNCKHCGSSKVIAVDNQPLSQPTKQEWSMQNRYDDELYVEFKCLSCEGYSTTVFKLIPKS